MYITAIRRKVMFPATSIKTSETLYGFIILANDRHNLSSHFPRTEYKNKASKMHAAKNVRYKLEILQNYALCISQATTHT